MQLISINYVQTEADGGFTPPGITAVDVNSSLDGVFLHRRLNQFIGIDILMINGCIKLGFSSYRNF
jgi:hypothetical protein